MAVNPRRANLTGWGAEESFDLGTRAANVLRVAVDVADTEIVVIGRDIYEFDRAANGVTAGRIAVVGHADDTPTTALTALAAAINANTTEPIAATKISANELLIYSTVAAPLTIACTETLAGSGNAWSAAAMYGGALAVGRSMTVLARVPTATEVTVGQMHVPLPFTPVFVHVLVTITSTGVSKPYDGTLKIAANLVTLTIDGAADWAATDTVRVLAIG